MAEQLGRNVKLRLLSYLVIFYMLLAFSWWTVLLFTKNRDAYQAKLEVLRLGMYAEKLVTSEAQFQQTPPYLKLSNEYKRQEWMILGEASVFVISLVIGVWLINRGYHKEVITANQRRNFLLSITHELKSPIASIRLVLETIVKRTLTTEQLKKFGNNALEETDRLNLLVNDLLLSAKLDTSYEPVYEAIQLDSLMCEIVKRLKNRHPLRRFDTNIKSVQLNGDRQGLTAVFTNLLENAIKYSPNDQPIGVDVEKLGDQIQVHIKDFGMGIPDSEKKIVFQKFYRVGNENTRKTKGTGLGLFIVDQIVKTHRGLIEIMDNRPCGTIFKISLPLNLEV